MKNSIKIFLAAVCLLFASVPVRAVIVSGALTADSAFNNGGVFLELTAPLPPPNTVGDDNFQSFNLFAFNENQNVVLTSNLNVDSLGGGGPGVLSVGTVVSSHYIFFDPSVNSRATGHVVFDAPILAIISSRDFLNLSDVFFNPGVFYAEPSLRGLEGTDSAVINGGDPNRIDVSLFANSPGDYLRVLTAVNVVLSAPGSAMFLCLSAVFLVFRRRARQPDRFR